MARQIEISVIVPAYNAQQTLPLTIKCLLNQDVSLHYEIIIIDDGSTDETPNIIKQFPTVIYKHQLNAGPACARNHGARIAQGKYLAFTDSDCAPHQNWLRELLKGFNHDEVGVVAGSYGITNKESLLAQCVYKEILFRHYRLMPDYPKSFGGYNFCVKKNVYWQVKGFNETYRRASGEDNDLSYKILESGYKIYFNRAALVDHVHPQRVLRYLKEQARHGQWRVLMYVEHPTMVKGDDYTFWKDVVEMPVVMVLSFCIVVSLFGGLSFIHTTSVLLISFLVFEMIASMIMINEMFSGIYFGFVTFFRAFARFFGFSTGILIFILKKIEKKFK